MANTGDDAQDVAIAIADAQITYTESELWTLQSPSTDATDRRLDANTPARPTRVAPVKTTQVFTSKQLRSGQNLPLTLPGVSVSILVFKA